MEILSREVQTSLYHRDLSILRTDKKFMYEFNLCNPKSQTLDDILSVKFILL